ncbi:MAG: hypothetical protein DLM63_10765 [Solirubrobacterales bacterium]|nr:MAG: hypothetical protein DLM63_10765 [Solirubrobacterales bacterium]
MLRPRRNLAALALLLVALTLPVAGCGSSSSSSSSGSASSTPNVGHVPTLKFALHAGLAFGAFHRYIYKPFKQGRLIRGGLLHHKLALVKAGLAGLFAYHEIKLAIMDARASPILSKLLTPLDALGAKLSALGTSIKGGHVDPAAVASTNSDVGSVSSLAHAHGVSVSDQTPSAAQLASP